ncbi:SNF2 family N-terminal domain-containing protein [Halteromyces radiatus]|uniref:SNF2 family N-terminal domain-containing protein n=1 Tax=Halteromyces radiatus TaxID=101107 RepID=UPI00221F5FAC|nr:SNF2 family N-terminal domain-containing protein [Halteromyces radiatus]KAI8089782.1 SNF2 family N-terminal domain-containing protein [Halteromyces radiatus]
MNPAIGDPTKRSMTTAQAGDELRKLLETINDEEPPPPESRSGTPDGLKVNLLEHQKIGFQWMTKQELSINKGGMLTDDMGLGKTVQALSIIVSRKSEDHAPPSDMLNMTPMQRAKRPVQSIKVKTTLVICPVSLMEQWAQEVRYKTENLSVYVYHGSRRTNDIYELSKYDVVITSYTMIGGEFTESHVRRGPLACLKFHRVILDEAHTIKNRNTRTAQACYRIEATHRWCLTATPIQNKIEELYSLIHFLQIRPYCDWSTFREEVVSPLRHGKSDVLKKVQVILKAIALRRSKKAQIDGRPILNLPERNVHFTHVDFSDRERQFYDFVDNRVQQSFNNYVEAGTVMQNYSNVLVLLLRLRQACLHPKLTTIELPQQRNDEEHFTENAKSLDKKVVDRLLSGKEELLTVECPICMDTAQEPRIISGCGHILCRECLQTYISGSAATGIVKSCPHCRGELVMDKIISVAKFLEVYAPNPEELSKQEKEEKAAKEEKELEASLGKVQEFVSSKKIDTMLEILAKTREESKGYDKTIVFSQFTSMLDIMEKPLKASGYKFGRYDGSIPVATRTKVLEQFYNDPAMEVLLVSTKCGSLGLNLTMANRVILMDIWWNPALENQAIDRVHRIGQTKDVEVHRIFINNTVEDRILELQRKKQAIADGALGEGTGEKIGRLGLQEMLYLFRGGRVPGSVDSLAGPSRT